MQAVEHHHCFGACQTVRADPFLTTNCAQTPPESADANIQNSYLVDESANGEGDGSLTELGLTYRSFPC